MELAVEILMYSIPFILWYFNFRRKKIKEAKYKAIFDNVWEVAGYRTFMSLRAEEIQKGNTPKVVCSNDKFSVSKIGNYLFYVEGHMFGDYHKVWCCK